MIDHIKVQTPLNYDYREWPGEIKPSLEKSMTIPDQTLPLSEIIARHARGLPSVGKEPIYYGEEEQYPDLKKMDLAEIQQLKENIREFTKDTQAKMAAEQKAISEKKQAERQAAKEKEFQLWMQKRKDNEKPDNPS